MKLYRHLGKRLLDLILAIALLAFFSPILILVAIILSIVNNGKILFLQTRPGLNAKPFTIYKFKTMRDLANANGSPLPDSERITPIGKIIRSLSLDELLQLVNVIKGDMSLIGPRPLLMEYLPLYNARQSRRHEVRPGITGLAQVQGRNLLSWEEKFEYDVRYVETLSLWLDISIILRTILVLFTRRGISADGEATMPRFTGTTSSGSAAK